MSFSDDEEGGTVLPALETGLFLSKNKYLNCEFLFPRECLIIVHGSSEYLGSILFSQIQPFNIYYLFTTILLTSF